MRKKLEVILFNTSSVRDVIVERVRAWTFEIHVSLKVFVSDVIAGQFHGNGITNQRFWALI